MSPTISLSLQLPSNFDRQQSLVPILAELECMGIMKVIIVFSTFSLAYPTLSLVHEVMKVRFSRGGRTVFSENEKHTVSKTRKQLNELKIELLAVILVPFRAPNSQQASRTVNLYLVPRMQFLLPVEFLKMIGIPNKSKHFEEFNGQQKTDSRS